MRTCPSLLEISSKVPGASTDRRARSCWSRCKVVGSAARALTKGAEDSGGRKLRAFE